MKKLLPLTVIIGGLSVGCATSHLEDMTIEKNGIVYNVGTRGESLRLETINREKGSPTLTTELVYKNKAILVDGKFTSLGDLSQVTITQGDEVKKFTPSNQEWDYVTANIDDAPTSVMNEIYLPALKEQTDPEYLGLWQELKSQ